MKSMVLIVNQLKLVILMTLLGMFAANANAAYKYEYKGNIFITTSGSPSFPGQDHLSSSALDMVIYSENLLEPGASLADILSYTISHVDEFLAFTLIYPLPVYDPMAGPGSSGNPFNSPTFSIDSVDSFGLPTSWNIGIDYSYRSPTAREFKRVFESSVNVDSVFGYYEGFTYLSGEIVNSPGVWTVSFISPVPETEAYAMLAAGLGIVGFAARKRNA